MAPSCGDNAQPKPEHWAPEPPQNVFKNKRHSYNLLDGRHMTNTKSTSEVFKKLTEH
jgi:hypothetical protein